MENFLVCSYRRHAATRNPQTARLVLVQQRELVIQNPIYLNPIYWVGLKSAHLVPTHPPRKSQLLLGGSGPEIDANDFFNNVIAELQLENREKFSGPDLNVNLYDPIDRTVIHKGLNIKLNSELQTKYSNSIGYFRAEVRKLPTEEKIYFTPHEIMPISSKHQAGQQYWGSLTSYSIIYHNRA